jgi:hypothetical protein
MKFLKTRSVSPFSVTDRTVISYPKGVGPGNRVVLNADGAIMLPKGATTTRPSTTGVRQPTDGNGYLRYNTDNSSASANTEVAAYFPNGAVGLEAYQQGTWTQVRAQGPAKIIQQNLGSGTYNAITQSNSDISTWFPINGDALTYVPGLAQGYDPQAYINNMIVLVENVFQIAGTNFTLVQSPGQVVGVKVNTGGTGYTANSTTIPVTFTAPGGGGTTAAGLATTNGSGVITSIRITTAGTNYSTVPTVSIAGGAGGSYTAFIAKAGYHIVFGTAVPDTKAVTVLYGFDQ